LIHETLDEPEVYAAAGIPRSAPDATVKARPAKESMPARQSG